MFYLVSLLYNQETRKFNSNEPDFEDQEDDIVQLGIVQNNEDLKFKEEGYVKHAFNLLISKRLGLHREIKDTRHEL